MFAEVAGTETALPNYRLLDHLGNQVGTVGSTILLTNPLDYTPFGQTFSGSTNDPFIFTGKERDIESGNDNFGARYYSSSTGRFMSPDWSSDPDAIPFADLSNPQSLNLYGYVQNNPLSVTDPDGHCGNSYSLTESFDGNVIQSESSSDGPCISTTINGILNGIGNAGSRLAQTATQAAQQVTNFVNAPRSATCMAGAAAGGAATGAVVGGVTGGIAGGAGGTLVAPGIGTVGGGVAGAAEGTTYGAMAGASLGTAYGMFSCATGAGSGGSGKFDKRNPSHRKMTASEIISQFKKGGIRSVFPSEKLGLTFETIESQARSGDSAAQTAVKLLTDSRFNK